MDSNPIRYADPLGNNVPFAPAAALGSGASAVGGCAANGVGMFFNTTALAISVGNQAGGLLNNHMNNPNLGGGGKGKNQSPQKLKQKEANDGRGKEGDYFIDENKRRFTKSETGEFYETFDSQDKDEYDLEEGIPVYGDGTYHEVMNSRFISSAVKFSLRSSAANIRILQILHDLYEEISEIMDDAIKVDNKVGPKLSQGSALNEGDKIVYQMVYDWGDGDLDTFFVTKTWPIDSISIENILDADNQGILNRDTIK